MSVYILFHLHLTFSTLTSYFFILTAAFVLRTSKEPLMRIELTTSSLPRKCSTTELQRLENTAGNSGRVERETRFEPATYSLEGYRSTS